MRWPDESPPALPPPLQIVASTSPRSTPSFMARSMSVVCSELIQMYAMVSARSM